MPNFESFAKIPRLNRDIIITEKIDGTNAQILIDGGPVLALGSYGLAPAVATVGGLNLYAGSRSRFLTLDYDNFGFAAWVRENAEELVKLGPGRHFGEWWGQGIQRGYGLKERRFSLFNVGRWIPEVVYFYGEPVVPFVPGEPPPACCHVVPVLARGLFTTECVYEALNMLRSHGSLAAPGWSLPEGIVIYHTAANQLFKVTLEGDEKPKGRE